MKIKYLIVILNLLFFTISTANASDKIYVKVNGLVCDFCARALEKVFSKQEEVESIKVDLDNKVITVNFKEGKSLDDNLITELIKDSGYDVQEITNEE